MNLDYDPSCDYEIVEPSFSDKEVMRMLESEMRVHLLPAMAAAGYEIKHFSVFCTVAGAFYENVGIYIEGTKAVPVIGFDLATLKACSLECDVDWIDQVRATMAYALANSFQEAMGLDSQDEEIAEEFATQYVVDGVANLDILFGRQAMKMT